MKVKTHELQRVLLDWAVAKARGVQVSLARGGWYMINFDIHPEFCNEYDDDEWQLFTPSTDWAQGGPIIEREGINLRMLSGALWEAETWSAEGGQYLLDGPTMLIAAMRCYVASKLGDEVEVPEGLMEKEDEH